MDGCYCYDSIKKCGICRDAKEKEENRKVCEGWNWNCTPRECAQEARDLGWSTWGLKDAMLDFGFSSTHIGDVLFEFGLDD